ncbi:MAG: acyl-CoA dehydrogenase family protein [Candidatus Hydrogenedentota bacterium]
MVEMSEKVSRIWEEALRAIQDSDAIQSAPDHHQVVIRSVASVATRIQALQAIADYAGKYGGASSWIRSAERLFLSEAIDAIANEPCLEGLAPEARNEIEALKSPAEYQNTHVRISEYEAIGVDLLASNARNDRSISTESDDDSEERELRSSTRKFAQDVVAPLAEDIHRKDLLIPETIISQLAEMGYFGLSIPEAYDGVGMNYLMMVLATEELSAASLGAAGSLMTRPEILSKALLKGGTETQKSHWLPKIASGECMVAVAVTEPNTGSDVAAVSCRATRTEGGFLLNGSKAWCTFAGRANVLALLARTDDSPGAGHKGLSLFIVDKDVFEGHDFVMKQRGGGVLTAKADATLGYRGMHSFTLQFDDYFVPASNLVGEEDGEGKGFYLQMDGFAVGRLQTGGRAVGLAQAALETTVAYANGRPQFGKPIAEYQNTRYEIGKMAVELEAARQLTYTAARAMDRGDSKASTLAAMAKLFSCRMAVTNTQRGQLMHGGWGYAEEYPISRYVVDALVLPIFEGVEPILEMKVIGRAILSGR